MRRLWSVELARWNSRGGTRAVELTASFQTATVRTTTVRTAIVRKAAGRSNRSHSNRSHSNYCRPSIELTLCSERRRQTTKGRRKRRGGRKKGGPGGGGEGKGKYQTGQLTTSVSKEPRVTRVDPITKNRSTSSPPIATIANMACGVPFRQPPCGQPPKMSVMT